MRLFEPFKLITTAELIATKGHNLGKKKSQCIASCLLTRTRSLAKWEHKGVYNVKCRAKYLSDLDRSLAGTDAGCGSWTADSRTNVFMLTPRAIIQAPASIYQLHFALFEGCNNRYEGTRDVFFTRRIHTFTVVPGQIRLNEIFHFISAVPLSSAAILIFTRCRGVAFQVTYAHLSALIQKSLHVFCWPCLKWLCSRSRCHDSGLRYGMTHY